MASILLMYVHACLLSLFSCGLALRDLTVVPYATGEDIVDAVIARLDTAFNTPRSTFWIEGDDSTFMKNVAQVESNFGTDPDTFATSHLGGIWQVLRTEFESTKDSDHNIRDTYAQNLVYQVSDTLDINWLNVEWEDLTKPIFSALAARFVLHLKATDTSRTDLCESIPTTDEKDLYAEFWYQCYRDELRGSAEQFEETIAPNPQVCTFPTDVVFVLDSSGSINIAHPDNWNRVRYFVGNFTAGLLGGSNNRNRIGIITYSGFGQTDYNLTKDRDSILEGIANLPYIGFSTNTADGLCELTDMNWGEDRLRLVVVMTDGRSNRDSTECGTTIEAPDIVNSALCPTPLYYVIGVTNNTDEDELQAIASGPQYIDHLDNFQNTEGFAALRRQQIYRICFQASAFICDGTLSRTNFGREDRVRYQLNVGKDGVTVRLCVTQGQVVLYASTTVSNPSQASNIFSFERKAFDKSVPNSIKCEDIFITPELLSTVSAGFTTSRRKRQVSDISANITIFVTIEGVAENSSFTLETPVGNSSLFSTSCRDDVCGANTACTDEILGYSCDCLSGYEFADNLRDCKDVNECERQPLPCDQSAYCTNNNGSYECTCHLGYMGDGKECTLDDQPSLKLAVIVICSVGGVLLALLIVFLAVIKIVAVTVPNQKKKHTKPHLEFTE